MNGLAEEGFVLFGGPLAGTENGRVRVLLIVDADDEDSDPTRLADDPGYQPNNSVITSIEPWTILVGADRLPIVDAQRITADLSGPTEAASNDA